MTGCHWHRHLHGLTTRPASYWNETCWRLIAPFCRSAESCLLLRVEGKNMRQACRGSHVSELLVPRSSLKLKQNWYMQLHGQLTPCCTKVDIFHTLEGKHHTSITYVNKLTFGCRNKHMAWWWNSPVWLTCEKDWKLEFWKPEDTLMSWQDSQFSPHVQCWATHTRCFPTVSVIPSDWLATKCKHWSRQHSFDWPAV